MADELDWLEMLVASERIAEWLSTVCGKHNSLANRRQAMLQMAEAAMEREAYAEEARQAGAVSRLTKVLATTEDLVLKQALVKFCTQLELASAFMHQARIISYGNLSINIKEGALGDGLGARIWVVAHTLCRELLEHPGLISGKSVLEIGSGCGLCGIVAAKLGAAQVVLSDFEEKVLLNLRDCVASNSQASHAGPSFSRAPKAAANSPHDSADAAADAAASPLDRDLFDPEDADVCDDLDGFFLGNPEPPKTVLGEGAVAWDHDNMRVRFLDWAEAVAAEERQAAKHTSTGSGSSEAVCAETTTAGQSKTQAMVPNMHSDETFDVVIGTDILYEEAHASLVAAVLRHRLATDGQALVCCAVRDQGIFDQFAAELTARQMRFKIQPVQPRADDHGIIGKQHDYEGGFVLVAAQHKSSSAKWHGDIM